MKRKFNYAKLMNFMAGAAMLVAVAAPRRGFCYVVFHEPKMPESLKKLK